MAGDRRWKRKADGVLVTTRVRPGWEPLHTSVLVTREDTGRTYWATWQGLLRKYEPLGAVDWNE